MGQRSGSLSDDNGNFVISIYPEPLKLGDEEGRATRPKQRPSTTASRDRSSDIGADLPSVPPISGDVHDGPYVTGPVASGRHVGPSRQMMTSLFTGQ